MFHLLQDACRYLQWPGLASLEHCPRALRGSSPRVGNLSWPVQALLVLMIEILQGPIYPNTRQDPKSRSLNSGLQYSYGVDYGALGGSTFWARPGGWVAWLQGFWCTVSWFMSLVGLGTAPK